VKILIHDPKPDRLVAWLAQVDRPTNTCHIANTAVQARFMLMSDPYDLVLLDVSDGGTSADELGRIAAQNNPTCKVVDLPPFAGTDGFDRSEMAAGAADAPEHAPDLLEEQAEAPRLRPKWRQFRRSSGAVAEGASGVKWRSFRRQVAKMPIKAPERPVLPEPLQAPREPVLVLPPRKPAEPVDTAVPAGLSVGRNLRQRVAEGA